MRFDASQRRLVVIEANEVPRRVIDDHIGREPGSTLGRLVEQGALADTTIDEPVDRELYPSQTWYSMNSGVPYEKHQVYWYGDPKPEEYPLYWQLAARAGRSVGLVGTLHSSPLHDQCGDGKYAFVLPDCFADDAHTIPKRYERFQEVNLELTSASGRNAHLRPTARHLVAAATVPTLGVRPSTVASVGLLTARIATRQVNKERLRVAQALLLSDMFLALGRRRDPDLAVFFTNHVASAMHRYWYAAYPSDWGDRLYPEEWVARYRDEVPAAMRALDRILGQVWRWCEATGRRLVFTTSMGQRGEDELDTSARGTAVVRDAERFARSLGVTERFSVGTAMVPQIHYTFGSDESAEAVVARIDALDTGDAEVDATRHGPVVTLTYHLGDRSSGTMQVDGRMATLDELGVTWEAIDDHRSGTHDPRGVLLVGDPSGPVDDIPPTVSGLDVAPAILRALGLEVPDHMASIGWSL